MSRAIDIAKVLEKLRRGEKLSDEEIEVLLNYLLILETVDRVVDKRLESRLRRYREAKKRGVKDVTGILGKVLGGGEARFVFKAVKDGETQSVIHQIFGSNGSLRHLGIEGVRGWDIEDPNKVSFIYRGNEYQFDVVSESKRVDRWRKKRSGH